MFEEITKKINDAKIIPVVKLESLDDALHSAEALLKGGIKNIEITFRTLHGSEGFSKISECISCVCKEFPQMLVAAGTVINPDLAKKAKDAGAQFLFSPGFNPATVDWCVENSMPIFPGVNSPSQIEQALQKNLSVLKFFPAEISGGTKMLKALSGPFPQVSFIPTGGINEENKNLYLSCKNVIALCGSWMISEDLIREKNWNKITEISRQAISL